MQLSLVVPAFRKDRWQKFYDSIGEAFHGEWEVIIVGPYEPDFKKDNMRWIEDWGCPTKCMQRGLLDATGDYISFTWDDVIYRKDMLDKGWEILKEHNFNPKIATIGKYVEGGFANTFALSDDFSLVESHPDAKTEGIPGKYLIQSTGITSRKEVMDIGGCDCRFEDMAYSVLDLSVRLQANGVKFIIQQGVTLDCTWDLGEEHAPVMEAWTKRSRPLWKHIYRNPITNIVIDKDNWKNAKEKWRRFNV